MAIDYGISSLDTGASDITYTGNEGPQDPRAMSDIDKIILQHWLQQGGSYGDDIPEEFKLEIIKIYGLDKMASAPDMAEGGIARLGYANGQLVQPGLGRPGYGGPQDWGQEERAEKVAAGTASQREIDLHTGAISGIDNPYTAAAQHENRELNRRVEENRIKRLAEAKAKEEQSWIERANEWHRKKNKAYYAKNYKKALEKFVTSNMKSELPEWYEEDTDIDELYDWIKSQNLPEKYSDLKGRDPNKTWEKYGYVPTSSTLPGIAGALIKSKPPTFDEVKAIKERYTGEINYTNKEADWLEEMKVRAPNQYAVYTGTKYDPIRKTFNPRDDGPSNQYPYPYQTASEPGGTTDVAEDTVTAFPTEYIRFAADGGRIPAAYGGIMGDDGRRRYGLGSIFKKAARGLKKIVKSPIGKAALMYGLGTWLGGTQAFGGGVGGAGDFFSRLKNPALLKNLITPSGWSEGNILNPLLRSKGKDWNKDKPTWGKFNPWKLGIMGGALYPVVKSYLGKDEDDDFTQTDLYKRWLAEKQGWDKTFAPVGDPANWEPIRFADGGRIGYKYGYGVDDEEEEEKHRTAALKAMYKRMGAQEGGLMDMGGMEKDYRNDGGFVPIGGQERADDVPARLSKNEFVFTADAVRAAGGGDIDKGAEIMENVMENLEEGGEISQQSQGLEGARNMFATSQRLEGVL